MYTEAIKDYNGKILYYIDHKDNGDLVRKSYSGIIEGIYSASRNVTQDYSGRVLAKGNTLGGGASAAPDQLRSNRIYTEAIKDYSGRILYYLDHKANGDVVRKSYSGIIEGTYSSSRNVTQDYSGRVLAKGNTLGGTSIDQTPSKTQDASSIRTPSQQQPNRSAPHTAPPAEYSSSEQMVVGLFAITGLTPIAAALHSVFSLKHAAGEASGFNSEFWSGRSSITRLLKMIMWVLFFFVAGLFIAGQIFRIR